MLFLWFEEALKNHLCSQSICQIKYSVVYIIYLSRCMQVYSPVSCIGKPRNGHSTPVVASPMLRSSEGSYTSTCRQHFMQYLMQPSTLLAVFNTGEQCWLLISLFRSPGSFSAKLLPYLLFFIMYWCRGLCLPNCRPVPFPLLNFNWFLFAHCSNLLRYLSFFLSSKIE